MPLYWEIAGTFKVMPCKVLDMGPEFAADNVMNRTTHNSVHFSESLLTDANLIMESPYFEYDFFRKFSISARATTGMRIRWIWSQSTALLSILRIVIVRSVQKMIWIAAGRIIAGVSYYASRVMPMLNRESNTMSHIASLIPLYKKGPIAEHESPALPLPAFMGFFNSDFIPKLAHLIFVHRWKRFTLWSRHVGLLLRSMCSWTVRELEFFNGPIILQQFGGLYVR